MTSAVLDASALLAVLNEELGAEIVLAALSDAVISAVNYSEVLKKAFEKGRDIEPVRALVSGWPIGLIPFDETLASLSAGLYPKTKEHGLSFADRACLALGIQRDATVFTADVKWKKLGLPVKLKLIRNAH